jgi:hypothetical protein
MRLLKLCVCLQRIPGFLNVLTLGCHQEMRSMATSIPAKTGQVLGPCVSFEFTTASNNAKEEASQC